MVPIPGDGDFLLYGSPRISALMRPATVTLGLVLVPPNFLQLWTNLIVWFLTARMMQSGSLVMALILSLLDLSSPNMLMNAPKLLLAALDLFRD
jgi:hypothetical protein